MSVCNSQNSLLPMTHTMHVGSTAFETFHWWFLGLIFIYIYIDLYIYLYFYIDLMWYYSLKMIQCFVFFFILAIFNEENSFKCLLSHTSKKNKINKNYFSVHNYTISTGLCVSLSFFFFTMILNMKESKTSRGLSHL